MKLSEINDNIHKLEIDSLDIRLRLEDANEKKGIIETKYLMNILFNSEYKNDRQRDTILHEQLAIDQDWLIEDNKSFIAKRELDENKIEIGFYKRMWEAERLLFISHNCFDHITSE